MFLTCNHLKINCDTDFVHIFFLLSFVIALYCICNVMTIVNQYTVIEELSEFGLMITVIMGLLLFKPLGLLRLTSVFLISCSPYCKFMVTCTDRSFVFLKIQFQGNYGDPE